MYQTPNIDFTTLSGNYSTAEVDTGFTWVNGSKIYKKSIHFGALPNATEKMVDSGISNFGNLVNLYAVAQRADKTAIVLPSASTNADNNVELYINSSSQIVISCGTNRSAYDCYATVFYTKSS